MTTDEQDEEPIDDERPSRPIENGDPADDPWQSIRERDPEALEALLVDHVDRLHSFLRYHMPPRLATKESVSDLTQSVVGDVLPSLKDATFEDEAAFQGWLYTCALNKVRERGRHWTTEKRDQDRSTPLHDVGEDGLDAAATAPSEAARRVEAGEALHEAIAQLSEDERTVVVLVRLEGLPHAFAAEVLGRSPSACRKLLARALSRLSGLLPEPG